MLVGAFFLRQKIIDFYSRNYRKLLIVPAIVFIASLFLAFVFPGVPKGIDFAGGTLVIVRSEKPIDAKRLETLLSTNFAFTDLSVSSISSVSGYGVTIRYAKEAVLSNAMDEIDNARQLLASNPTESLQHSKKAVEIASKYVPQKTISGTPNEAFDEAEKIVFQARENITRRLQEIISTEFGLGEKAAFQRQEVSPTLGQSFFATALNVSIFSIILLVIFIFIIYREIVPSLAIVASMVFDVVFALALMAVFGMPLSLSSVPALLMLAGYSIDTDILQTTRILSRREGTPIERFFDSMKTGLTMTMTALGAIIVMLVFGYLNQVTVLYSIAAVLFFGLLGDPIATWLMNSGILLMYVEGKKR